MASSQFSPVSHVLFDLDGLLLDTERLYSESIQNIVSQYGKQYPWELKVKCMGTKGEVGAKLIIDDLELPLTVSQYFEKVNQQYDLLFPTAQLLPDSEVLYTAATEQLAATYGKTYPWDVKVKQMGENSETYAKIIIEGIGLPLSVDEYLKISHFHKSQFLPSAKLMPGAEKLVRHLHTHKIPIAIASGGAQASFDLKTTNHKEFFSLFNHVVLASSDPEVKAGKPSPDVFLVCAQRFPDKPDPKKCLVFEDAPNGVEAGVAANMQVVMVPDERLDKNLTKGASIVLKSLEEFKPQLFGLPPY